VRYGVPTRAEDAAAELLAELDMLSSDQIAERLGLSREAVLQKRCRGEMLGTESAKRGVRFNRLGIGIHHHYVFHVCLRAGAAYCQMLLPHIVTAAFPRRQALATTSRNRSCHWLFSFLSPEWFSSVLS
jgi:hypothetical protein